MSHKDESEQVRLNKYIAQCGICSRRDADKIIEEGRVSVNGQPALAGTKVNPGDVVKIDGKRIKLVTDTKVYAYYKPEGVVCTQRDAHAQRTVATEIKTPVKVNYAGRLDANSSGLLILSNDGELINRMMKSSNNHEKEYVVRVDKEVNGAFLRQMAGGVYIEDLDVTTKRCKVVKTGRNSFRIILTQGLNRQIRRMCKALGYNVRELMRIRVLNIELGSMKPGELREVTGRELTTLYSKCGLRKDTASN
ncbi:MULTISPECIES: pseudouridine synthase [Butyrivibrio]|uniref:Pseudouridine synthase n=1 Tax=Butyrivibrio fibrisolvens TaxID=831 RepID=A0A1H9NH85_BUTFI|nr:MULTISPECIES: pseudouridine synthase [Butyrivibrio]MBQ1458301.1 rRNA pseudouridine synthase [Butyrivibrio sp.]MCR4637205.1 rRNA pseudouridine synthase [Butyrivibrio sp.]SEP91191.1 23S rRNA pseudouridine2604 synthase [Butyrivibrio sp. TB]SER35292.1 23S rRNA pseudouridine2604 synthase [Butyrivibrio fibrisolvens]